MLPLQTRRKADVVVSIIFILFGAFIIYEASQMPWTRGHHAWYASPGLFPTVIGILLILFSGRVLLSTVQQGGHRDIVRPFLGWLRHAPMNRKVHRVLFMIVWIGLYVFYGLGRFNYELVSAIFLAGFIGVFWLPGSHAQILKRAAIVVAVSIAVPVVMAYVFSTFLFVPAP